MHFSDSSQDFTTGSIKVSSLLTLTEIAMLLTWAFEWLEGQSSLGELLDGPDRQGLPSSTGVTGLPQHWAHCCRQDEHSMRYVPPELHECIVVEAHHPLHRRITLPFPRQACIGLRHLPLLAIG